MDESRMSSATILAIRKLRGKVFFGVIEGLLEQYRRADVPQFQFIREPIKRAAFARIMDLTGTNHTTSRGFVLAVWMFIMEGYPTRQAFDKAIGELVRIELKRKAQNRSK